MGRKLVVMLSIAIIAAFVYIFADALKLDQVSLDFSSNLSGKKLPKRPGYFTEPIIERKNPTVVHLGDFTTNIIRDGKASKFFKSKVTVHTSDKQTSGEIKANNILVRDAVIDTLSGKRYEEIATREGKLKLKSEVNAALNRVVTKGTVEEVFFTQFIIQ